MKIGELAQIVGIPASTLRYYEQIGLIPFATRISGQRHYNPDIIPRLNLIRIAREVGFSLDEIQQLFNGKDPDTLQQTLQDKIRELEQVISKYQMMKQFLTKYIACGCRTIEKYLTESWATSIESESEASRNN